MKSLKLTAFISCIVLLITPGCFQPNSTLYFAAKPDPGKLSKGSSDSLEKPGLDPSTTRSVDRYGKVIQKYSLKYEMDWRLVLAVMKQESRFRPQAKSHRGAYGLMQIMPTTAAELTEILGMPQAKNPYNNIKAGVYHLRRLYRFFEGARDPDRTKLALAAYNAGLTRILDARELASYLGGNPNSWKSVQDAFPLLSNRFATLHQRVWGDRGPRSGYFRNYQETTNYVESIMQHYDEYRLALR